MGQSIKKEIKIDLILNFVSLGFLGAGGLLSNILIGKYFGSTCLGIFNQAYAVFILLSQAAVAGLHSSVLLYVSKNSVTESIYKSIISTACVGALFTSLLITIIGYAFSFAVGLFFKSNQVMTAFISILPGLLFFSQNKILLNVLNALEYMRWTAIFTSLRYILLVSSIIGLILIQIPVDRITLAITASEFVLFILLVSLFIVKKMFGKVDLSVAKDIFSFGVKMMISSMTVELNTRVDIFFLGYLANDSVVGIYSFALIFAEGFYQLGIVGRKFINPKIAKLSLNDSEEQLNKLIQKTKKWIFGMALTGAVSVAIIYQTYTLYFDGKEYSDGFIPLVILMSGMVITSVQIVFGNIMAQSGYPYSESFVNLVTISTNILLNFILVSRYGMIGAAFGTLGSYYANAVMVKILSKKYLSVKV